MLVEEFTTTAVAGLPPTLTVAPAVKFVPVRVITVPPATGPSVGATLVKVGAGGMYVKAAGKLAVPPEVVTLTTVGPATPAGVTPVMVVVLTTTTAVAGLAPTLTVAPGRKFVPVRVIAVPPATGPWVGATLVKVGAGVGAVASSPQEAISTAKHIATPIARTLDRFILASPRC
jgi:hypothetical protein